MQVFKSSLETRCDTTVIRTHDGMSFNALRRAGLPRNGKRSLRRTFKWSAIEEVQFFDEGVVGLCQRLADRGVQVVAAGLDQDFRGLPFGFMPTLMSLADNVMKLHAICKVCGEEASRTQRLVDGHPAAEDDPLILVGADERYEARCRRCHKVRKAGSSVRSRRPAARNSGSGNGKNGHATENNNGKYLVESAFVEEDGTQLEMFPEIAAHAERG